MDNPAVKALQYIKNTGGNVTKAIFMDDHEPIGHLLWKDVSPMVDESTEGTLTVNAEGEKFIKEVG